MKAAIYNPYLDTLGGGERYTMAFASVLNELGYDVDVEWKDASIIEQLEKRFNLKLKDIRTVDSVQKGDGYDACFWVSDGSIPLLRSRKNFLHFQMPFRDVEGKSLMNRMKLIRINKVVCNSYFTKKFIDKEFPVESVVVYPPVSVNDFKPLKKEKLIVYVGRFSNLTQSKNQDLIIKLFKRFYDVGYGDWKLVLMGGTEVGVGDYLDELRESAKGYPVSFIESPSFSKIKEYLGKATFFWSAAGYGVDENKDPEKTEHFGITVVEAMASGAIPIVFNSGGHQEIISDTKNGFLWNDHKDVLKVTRDLIKNKEKMKELSKKALNDSKFYEYDRFKAQVEELLK